MDGRSTPARRPGQYPASPGRLGPATILGMALFSEPLSLMQGIGGFLIVVGGVAQILSSTKTPSSRGDAEAKQPEMVGQH